MRVCSDLHTPGEQELTQMDVVVCDGDETGQELLVEALRVLDPDLLGLPINLHHFDLSLENRRRTDNAVVHEAAAAMRDTGLGVKAATITPVGADDVGSPNRILREAVDGSVIVRSGRRIPGVAPLAPIVNPIVVVRMAVGDAYGAAEERRGEPGSKGEEALRVERIERGVCRDVAEYSFVEAASIGGVVYGGPKWTVSPVYEGMLKEELDAAAERHPEVLYRPMLIDAAYAGFINESVEAPVVMPTLNRDGDCLSDLVLALFGSIAGAESILLALDDDLRPSVAMAEAPHGTAPTLMGRNIANPLAMVLACSAVVDYASRMGHDQAAPAAKAIQGAAFGAAADGVRTNDLGGSASTSEVVDEIIARLRA